jgi:beta-glucosidase
MHSFRNPDLPLAARIDDLASRLTLEEKINQLVHENNPVERLGIPAYNWWSEACHGVGRNGRATVFPQVIGLAATWNRALVGRIADVIATEARAKHHAADAAGLHGQYQGLTFWTPNVNIFRDPRWGRGQETFGEDPLLSGELGAAMVRGLQGGHPHYYKVTACAKHFAVHSGPEDERHSFDARPSAKDLEETYLPAFKKLVDAGVEAVMGAYNRVRGEPACASKFLLGEVLRGRWKFAGHIVSDCGAIDDFHQHHKVTADAAESAALAVRRGCDLNCGCTYNDLVIAVRRGLVSEAEIDTSLRRLLAVKFRLGLFDPPERVPHSRVPVSVVDCAEHRALARLAAAESIVLLKNKGNLLPLRRDPASILVVGPTAASINVLLGNYYGVSSRLVTLMEGITGRVAEGTRVEYRVGCPLSQDGAPGVNYTFPSAGSSEIVIAVMGLDPTLEGEEGDTVASATGGDRRAIELPPNQLAFLRELRGHSKKLVLVLTGGSAIAAPEAHELCDAVLHVWYPGCEGGTALADVLFGDVPPSGRLPVTVPRATADLPPFDDYAMRGRTYRFAEKEPLYPFGFGLGYTRVAYGPLVVEPPALRPGQTVILRTTVENTGDSAVDETVQCYLVPPRDWPDAPRAVLLDFQKIGLPPRSTTKVSFEIASDAFRQFDAGGRPVLAPGRHGLVIGSASPGPRAIALGAPEPATGEILVGP